VRPDRSDLICVSIRLMSAAVILFGPRTT